MSSDDGVKTHTNHTQPQPPAPAHNMEDLQSELERVSSAMMSAAPPAIPVTRVESNDDGDGPSTADDPSSFITLMPPSARPIVIPPPNFPVEVGELTVSPSTVRISSDEQLGMAGLGEMTLRIGVTAATNSSVIVERPPETPAKFITAEIPEPAVESPSADEEESSVDVDVEDLSVEEQSPVGRSEKYTCNDCGKTFSYKLSWINHKLTHAGVAPFECKKCGKAFAYNSSVYNHMKIPGRCKGKRPKARSAATPKTKEEEDDESTDAVVEEEEEDSHEEANQKRPENKGQKLKQNVGASVVEPEKKLSSSRSVATPTPTPKVNNSEETVEIVAVVPGKRGRGRPPKHPRPATAPNPSTPAPAPAPVSSTPKAVTSSKRDDEKMSLADKRRESEMHRSRSQRRIQPPMWMRNMEMDYEIPVTHGIFQGDNSRPLSTGATWREVNSLTNEKRRKSTGDSASDEDCPALQRQDIVNDVTCNGSISKDEEPGNESSLAVENGNVSESSGQDSNDQSRRRSNEQHGRESNASEAANSSVEEIRVPKKRGRKKKVVIEEPTVEQSNVVPQSNEKSVPSQANNTNTHANESVSSPTKRSLRGLPHRSEVVVETCTEVQKSPIPKKKLKVEEREEEEEESVEVTLPVEVGGGEEQMEGIEEEDEEQVEEEEEVHDTDVEDVVEEEDEEEEEQRQEEETMADVEAEDEDDNGTNSTLGMEPMNEDEDEVYQEEEEEEDTDVVEGSDNEQPPPLPPPENPPADPVIPIIQAAAASGSVPVPVGEFDLKSAAITFLNKKISNRNMHRIRRELMELTDRGDYFQLTQWAPLAAGFLQAMLLRNFSKE